MFSRIISLVCVELGISTTMTESTYGRYDGNALDTNADLVFAVSSDRSPNSMVLPGELGGFDVEITKAVCERAGLKCAFLNVPWYTVIARDYAELGWDSNPRSYPGVGINGRWFDCASGVYNTIIRQASLSFSNPYTNPAAETAGFLAKSGTTMLNDASDIQLGLRYTYASTEHFLKNNGAGMTFNTPTTSITKFDTKQLLFEALDSGAVDAVLIDKSEVSQANLASKYQFIGPELTDYALGMSFACHTAKSGAVTTLNTGLDSLKADTTAYNAICSRYPTIPCDNTAATYTGNRLTVDADIIIGMEADWYPYSLISEAEGLHGFDVDLILEVCARAGVNCAMVAAPWQSVLPKDYKFLGWDSNPKIYPGIGFNYGWYDCSSGCRNTISRQAGLQFTHPYTDPKADKAGFLALTSTTMVDDASNVKVGMQMSFAANAYFLINNGEGKKYNTPPADIFLFPNGGLMFGALASGAIDVIFYGKGDAAKQMATGDFHWVGQEVDDFANGVAFACHPSKGNVLTTLNDGLQRLKADTAAYSAICDKYPTVPCDLSLRAYFNDNRLTTDADITIGLSASAPPYSQIDGASQLVGFDVEVVEEACALAGLKCSMVIAPAESILALKHTDLGWATNPRKYAGVGALSNWFDCASGVRNTVGRQPSFIFTHSYTDASADRARIFVKPNTNIVMSTAKIGLTATSAVMEYFLANHGNGEKFTMSSDKVFTYANQDLLEDALKTGAVDMALVAESDASAKMFSDNEFYGDAIQGFAGGMAFACAPSKEGAVGKLNNALSALLKGNTYDSICARWPTVPCYRSKPNLLTGASKANADIIIGVEADRSPYSFVDNASSLTGFDVELTHSICAAAGVKCALVPVPLQSIVPTQYARYGWNSNPLVYSGIGFNSGWFDCAAGTQNTVPRQASYSFTHPYTNPAADTAGFIAKTGTTMLPDASNIKVGLQTGHAASVFFLRNNGPGKRYNTPNVFMYDGPAAFYQALADDIIDAVVIGTEDGALKIAAEVGSYGWIGGMIDDFANGMALSCHPGKGDIVAKLNQGLLTFRSQVGYVELCDKYPAVPCTIPAAEVRYDRVGSIGSDGCRCLTEAEVLGRLPVKQMSYVYVKLGYEYLFPSSYGAGCDAYDHYFGLHAGFDPFDCLDADGNTRRDGRCNAPWCFVDECCDKPKEQMTHFITNSPMLISYATCCSGLAQVQCQDSSACTWDGASCDVATAAAPVPASDCPQLGEAQCSREEACTWTASGCGVAEAATCPLAEGSASCKCLTEADLIRKLGPVNGKLAFTHQGTEYLYPTTYGASCAAPDHSLARRYDPTGTIRMSADADRLDPWGCLDADGNVAPGKEWCQIPWCYVEPCSCAGSNAEPSQTFAGVGGAPLFHSFQTCCYKFDVEYQCTHLSEGMCKWTDNTCIPDQTQGSNFLSQGCALDANTCEDNKFCSLSASSGQCVTDSVALAEFNDRCWGCGPGTFYDSVLDSCSYCAMGGYTTEPNQVECTRCSSPISSTTLRIGSVDPSECVCDAGSYLDINTNTCMPCLEGMECPGGFLAYVQEGYWVSAESYSKQNPLEVYLCNPKEVCPGGDPEMCVDPCAEFGSNSACDRSRKVGLACASCPEGYAATDIGCSECSGLASIAIVCCILGMIIVPQLLYHVLHATHHWKLTPRESLVIACEMTIEVIQIMGVLGMITIEWPDPMNAAVKNMEHLTLEIDALIPTTCMTLSSLNSVRYLMSVALVPGALMIILFDYQIGKHLPGRFKWKWSAALNLICKIFNTIFISQVSTGVLPFICYSHPGGHSKSVFDYPATICGSSDHVAMSIMGACSMALAVAFFCYVCFEMWRAPGKLNSVNGDEYMEQIVFCIEDFKSGAYYFNIMMKIQEFLLSMVPVINPDEPRHQITMFLVIFLLSIVVVAHVYPFKAPLLSAVMVIIYSLILLVLTGAKDILPQATSAVQLESAKTMFGFAITAFAVNLGFVFNCLVNLIMRKHSMYASTMLRGEPHYEAIKNMWSTAKDLDPEALVKCVHHWEIFHATALETILPVLHNAINSDGRSSKPVLSPRSFSKKPENIRKSNPEQGDVSNQEAQNEDGTDGPNYSVSV